MFYKFIIAFAIVVQVVSCKKEKNNNMDMLLLALAPAPVSVAFTIAAGDAAVDCSSSIDGVAGGNGFKINDLRFFVSDVKLVSESGVHPLALDQDGAWQYKNVALLDFENATGNCNGSAATNVAVKGLAPRGNYTGIEFTLGVPVELNHLDVGASTTPAPLNTTGMFWTWLTGYKFMKLDFATTGNAGNFHLGSMGCPGDSTTAAPSGSCKFQNRSVIRLTRAGGFDPATHKVKLDLKQLLAKVSYTDNKYKCHAMKAGQDLVDCPKVYPALGVDYATGDSSGSQSAFSIQ